MYGTLFISLMYVSTAAARCYNLQGTAPPDGSFVACNPDAEVSACCASNKAQPDICMQGGLCYATMDSYSGYLYGNGCTDPTASDDACPIVCPASKHITRRKETRRDCLINSTEANGWKAFNVLPCTMSTWCCREASDSTNCCNNSAMIISGTATSLLGRFIDGVIPGSSATSNSTNTTDTNATTTATTTITTTASAESDSSNTTTVVGAAVGAVLGVACIIALVGMLWMMRKVKNLKKEMQSLKQDTYAPSSNAVMSPQQPYHVPQNAGPTTHAYEADWNNGRYEIDGTGK
ncbi:hypothetical protein D6D24_00979 [Aureobasidium pullulans]|uniref:Mid2 domain-containing protein n=1 Tax=Aureobasidium pullulans TaxID=5580 RepID=A0A4S8WDX5_AURPU|nr:hypothetical protein D6D24_00979 [Aureobasidium pullulans]